MVESTLTIRRPAVAGTFYPSRAERLQAEATRRGITVDDLVAPLLAASERAQDPQGPVDEQPHA